MSGKTASAAIRRSPSGVATRTTVGPISRIDDRKIARIAPRAMRFSRSGLIQYLIRSESAGARTDERDARAVTIEVERGLGGGVLPADHDDVPP